MIYQSQTNQMLTTIWCHKFNWISILPTCWKSKPPFLKSRFILWHDIDFEQRGLDFRQGDRDFRQGVLAFQQVGWPIGWWLVCHNFLKVREAPLPCSCRSTCFYCLNLINSLIQIALDLLNSQTPAPSSNSLPLVLQLYPTPSLLQIFKIWLILSKVPCTKKK